MATAPRPVLPGKTYHLVSRCVGRTFRLVPLKAVNLILWYCLAVALSLTGVEIHEFCFMSNHVHLMVTDTRGELPKFMNRLNSLASRCLNALRRWSGTNFERDYTRIEELETSAALDTCAYILANPCRADLVVNGKDWRGLTSVGMSYGEKLSILRLLHSDTLWPGVWGEDAQGSSALVAEVVAERSPLITTPGKGHPPQRSEHSMSRERVMGRRP